MNNQLEEILSLEVMKEIQLEELGKMDLNLFQKTKIPTKIASN